MLNQLVLFVFKRCTLLISQRAASTFAQQTVRNRDWRETVMGQPIETLSGTTVGKRYLFDNCS